MAKRFISLILALALLVLCAEGALAAVKCVYCDGKGEVACSNCGGSGSAAGSVRGSCFKCLGSGYTSCTYCGGTGKLGSEPSGSSDSGSSVGGGTGEASASLSKTKLTLVAGRSETLKVNWASGKVKWSSSDKKVATVSSKGKVNAKKAGKCTITAKVGKQKLKCRVTVKKKVYAKSIKLKKTSATLLEGAELALDYSVSPSASKITEKWSVSFSSGDRSVATVDKTGKVTARKAGQVTINAKLKIKKGKTRTAKFKLKVETGLARFNRWFKNNCVSEGGNKVLYTGRNGEEYDKIVQDASTGAWTLVRHEHYYDGFTTADTDVTIAFNNAFTGSARLYFYNHSSDDYLGDQEEEATATVAVKSLNLYAGYDWTTTKGTLYGDLANAQIASLLSAMQVPLVNEAKLNAKGGWRDLGLSGY